MLEQKYTGGKNFDTFKNEQEIEVATSKEKVKVNKNVEKDDAEYKDELDRSKWEVTNKGDLQEIPEKESLN